MSFTGSWTAAGMAHCSVSTLSQTLALAVLVVTSGLTEICPSGPSSMPSHSGQLFSWSGSIVIFVTVAPLISGI